MGWNKHPPPSSGRAGSHLPDDEIGPWFWSAIVWAVAMAAVAGVFYLLVRWLV